MHDLHTAEERYFSSRRSVKAVPLNEEIVHVAIIREKSIHINAHILNLEKSRGIKGKIHKIHCESFYLFVLEIEE